MNQVTNCMWMMWSMLFVEYKTIINMEGGMHSQTLLLDQVFGGLRL